VQLFRVKHRQSNCRNRIGQQRFSVNSECAEALYEAMLPVRATWPSNRLRAGYAGPARRAAFRPPPELRFARRVIQRRDADMVVREARLQLLGNLGEHFIGIQRGDGVS